MAYAQNKTPQSPPQPTPPTASSQSAFAQGLKLKGGWPRQGSRVDYLGQTLLAEGITQNKVITLPPIPDMAEYFDCSCMQVYDDLRELKRQGFSYQLSSLNDPVELRCHPKLISQNKEECCE